MKLFGSADIPDDLRALRGAVRNHGHDIRFVGGCVRDMLLGHAPKDFDLATDADILEQIEVYEAVRVPFYRTGEAHGTLTVRLPSGVYEITSLREETDHDGRHAVCTFTRDWLHDLGRRDLTINAMALTFDGDLIDPFGGQDDLGEGRIRFVGDAGRRMREDYLRILRWLRFHARLSPMVHHDPETAEAVRVHARGLEQISRERVWMEMSKIVLTLGAVEAMNFVQGCDIGAAIGLEAPVDGHVGGMRRFGRAHALSARFEKNDPTLLLAAYLGNAASVRVQAEAWRWSRDERDRGVFYAQHAYNPPLLEPHWLCAHDGHAKPLVQGALLLRHDPDGAEALQAWSVPEFPVKAQDLIDRLGLPPGIMLGQRLRALRDAWAVMGYKMDREALLAYADVDR